MALGEKPEVSCPLPRRLTPRKDARRPGSLFCHDPEGSSSVLRELPSSIDAFAQQASGKRRPSLEMAADLNSAFADGFRAPFAANNRPRMPCSPPWWKRLEGKLPETLIQQEIPCLIERPPVRCPQGMDIKSLFTGSWSGARPDESSRPEAELRPGKRKLGA